MLNLNADRWKDFIKGSFLSSKVTANWLPFGYNPLRFSGQSREMWPLSPQMKQLAYGNCPIKEKEASLSVSLAE